MDWPLAPVAAAAVFFATAATTAALCELAPRLGLLARPNARSSHERPKPTGGGVAFALPLLVVCAIEAARYPPAVALLPTGAAIAVVGLLDDRWEVWRSARLVLHCVLAAGIAWWLFAPPALLAATLILGLVWWINLYNFMDGIDGLAASQAGAYAAAALVLGDIGGSAPMLWALVAANAAFLCFNWAPARIFMGDAGAGLLGLVVGVLALWLWRDGELAIVASAILLLTFWFDASYTLIVRVATGQAFARPHRTHLYQIVARRVGHGYATGFFWLHFLGWLVPWAALSVAFPPWRFACLAGALLPLALACVVLKPGLRPREAANG